MIFLNAFCCHRPWKFLKFNFGEERLKKRNFVTSQAVVVAPVEEPRYSVQASKVQIPGQTCFFRKCHQMYSHWAFGYLLITCHKSVRAYSSSFFPVSYHLNIVNISIASINQERKYKNTKRGRERPQKNLLTSQPDLIGHHGAWWHFGCLARSLIQELMDSNPAVISLFFKRPVIQLGLVSANEYGMEMKGEVNAS